MNDNRNTIKGVLDKNLVDVINEENKKVRGINTVTMIIFFLIIFLISSILVMQLSIKSSDAVKNSIESQKVRVATSYINMMIRQNDSSNAIDILELNGKYKDYKGLIINNYAGEKDLKAAIFYKDNTIYELLYDGNFKPELAEKIITVDGFEISKKNNLIKLKISSKNNTINRFINLRSGGL